MNTAVVVTIAAFMAGVIYALGRYSARVDDHDRRLTTLETTVLHIDQNIAAILHLFQNGGPQ